MRLPTSEVHRSVGSELIQLHGMGNGAGPFFAVLYGLSSITAEQVRFLAVAAPVGFSSAPAYI